MILANRKWALFFGIVILAAVIVRLVPVRPLFIKAGENDWLEFETDPERSRVGTLAVDTDSISERPLFDASRRPPSTTPAPVVRQTAAPRARIALPVLTGTMKTGSGEMIAYVSFGSDQQAMKIRVGDFRDPWVVESIGDGVVSLLRDGEEFEIELRKE